MKTLLSSALAALLFAVSSPPVFAFTVLWSTIKQQSDWSPVRDLTGDMNQTNIDISSDGNFSQGTIGAWDSVDVSSDGTTSGYVYFRFLMTGNPLSWNNSLGTWQINNKNCYEILICTNPNATPTTTQNYAISISKTNAVQFYLGTNSTPTNNLAFGNITQSGSVWTEANGNLVVTDTGVKATGSTEDMCYIDVRVPFSWLSAQGVTLNTFIRAFYGTSNQDNNINKDFMTGASLDFTVASPFTFADPSVNGALYDTRDTAPSSNAGVWLGGESLTVSGFGWPGNRTLTVEVYDPSGATRLWSGTVTTSSTGGVTNAALLAVPLTWGPGYYRINVVNPIDNTTSRYYDSFEVRAPKVDVTKAASPTQGLPSTQITYTVSMSNTGNVAAAMTTITDTLPAGFTYVTGSTTGLTTANPSISGQTLTWNGSWNIPAGNTVTLSFKALTPNVRGAYTNVATAAGTNFGPYSSGQTAPVQVIGPAISMTKSVDKASAKPGETLTYTITYGNTGEDDASVVIFLDTVPPNTTYVTSSAQGAGTAIQYSHDGGATWNGSDAAPVTNIKWTYGSTLTPGSGGAFSFRVTVD